MTGWSPVLLFLVPLLSLGEDQEDVASVLAGVRQMVSGDTPRPAPPPQLSFLPEYYQRPDPHLLSDHQVSLTCLACQTAVAGIIDLYLLGVDFPTIEAGLEGLCELLGIFDQEVCHGGIANYGPVIEYIVMNR